MINVPTSIPLISKTYKTESGEEETLARFDFKNMEFDAFIYVFSELVKTSKDNAEKTRRLLDKFQKKCGFDPSWDIIITLRACEALFKAIGELEIYLPDIKNKEVTAFHHKKVKSFILLAADLHSRLTKDKYVHAELAKLPEDSRKQINKLVSLMLKWLNSVGFFTGADKELELYASLPKRKSKGSRKDSLDQLARDDIQPITIPSDTTWEDITISFRGEFEISLKVKDINNGTYDYERMGFADSRIKDSSQRAKPVSGWKFLQLLATNKGVFNLERLDPKTKSQYKKQKTDLSKRLKQILKIKEDPFEKYDPEIGYKTKFTLIPEPVFRDDYRDRDTFEEDERFSDLHEQYQLQTPQM